MISLSKDENSLLRAHSNQNMHRIILAEFLDWLEHTCGFTSFFRKCLQKPVFFYLPNAYRKSPFSVVGRSIMCRPSPIAGPRSSCDAHSTRIIKIYDQSTALTTPSEFSDIQCQKIHKIRIPYHAIVLSLPVLLLPQLERGAFAFIL